MSEQLGKLVLRLGLGGLFLFHGIHRLFAGLDPVKEMLAAHNMAATLAYGVYLGELLAPVLVILGLFSRIGAALIALNIVALVLLAGIPKVALVSAAGSYALETESLYFMAAVAVMLLGAGRLSVGGGRWN